MVGEAEGGNGQRVAGLRRERAGGAVSWEKDRRKAAGRGREAVAQIEAVGGTRRLDSHNPDDFVKKGCGA